MNYVLADIHGNSEAFDAVLNLIKLKEDDHLYILGDVVDRGPDGIALLQRIRKMENTTLLLGNHEYMMIEALRNTNDLRKRHVWRRNGCEPTYNSFQEMSEEDQEDLLQYLEKLPIQETVTIRTRGQPQAEDLVTFVLVHAAPVELFPAEGWDYSDERMFAVWHRMLDMAQRSELAGKITIFGHTPTENIQYSEWPKMRIAHGKGVIDIDCGCAYPTYGGQLGCLRLEDMTEYYSAEGIVTAGEAAAWKNKQLASMRNEENNEGCAY